MENWRECCPMSRESLSPSGGVAVYDNICTRMYRLVAVRFQWFLFFFPGLSFFFFFSLWCHFVIFHLPMTLKLMNYCGLMVEWKSNGMFLSSSLSLSILFSDTTSWADGNIMQTHTHTIRYPHFAYTVYKHVYIYRNTLHSLVSLYIIMETSK